MENPEAFAVAAPVAAESAAPAAAEESKAEEKAEEKEESDDDMVSSLDGAPCAMTEQLFRASVSLTDHECTMCAVYYM